MLLLDPRHDAIGLDLGRFFRGVAHYDVFAVEENDRGSDALALLVRNDDGLAMLVDIRDRRVSRSQVDPVNALETFRHGRSSRCRLVGRVETTSEGNSSSLAVFELRSDLVGMFAPQTVHRAIPLLPFPN